MTSILLQLLDLAAQKPLHLSISVIFYPGWAAMQWRASVTQTRIIAFACVRGDIVQVDTISQAFEHEAVCRATVQPGAGVLLCGQSPKRGGGHLLLGRTLRLGAAFEPPLVFSSKVSLGKKSHLIKGF